MLVARSSIAASILVVAICGVANSQATLISPTFEVASVKPAGPRATGDPRGFCGGPATGRINYRNVSLMNVLLKAFERTESVSPNPGRVPLPSLAVALQDFGLKLEKKAGMIEVLVVESIIRRPIEN
jgi:hypothetical protein